MNKIESGQLARGCSLTQHSETFVSPVDCD